MSGWLMILKPTSTLANVASAQACSCQPSRVFTPRVHRSVQGNTGSPVAAIAEAVSGHAGGSQAHLSAAADALQELIISSPMDCKPQHAKGQVQHEDQDPLHPWTRTHNFPELAILDDGFSAQSTRQARSTDAPSISCRHNMAHMQRRDACLASKLAVQMQHIPY